MCVCVCACVCVCVWQDNKNTQNYRVVAVDQTRTSTDVILAGFTRDVDAKRTNLDTTVRICVSVERSVLDWSTTSCKNQMTLSFLSLSLSLSRSFPLHFLSLSYFLVLFISLCPSLIQLTALPIYLPHYYFTASYTLSPFPSPFYPLCYFLVNLTVPGCHSCGRCWCVTQESSRDS